MIKIEDIQRLALPSVAMLIKLMRRKQRGKKRFSEEFEADIKLQFLEELYQTLLSKKIKEDLSQKIDAAARIAEECIDEIEMISLKRDYQWIKDTLDNIRCLTFERR